MIWIRTDKVFYLESIEIELEKLQNYVILIIVFFKLYEFLTKKLWILDIS